MITMNKKDSETMIKENGLDWELKKTPLHFEFNGQRKTIENKVALVRSDSGLSVSVMGDGYNIIQNRDSFKSFDSLMEANNDFEYVKAGALRGGSKIFIQAKIGNNLCLETKGGIKDVIEKRITLVNSHDGSSLQMLFTPFRLVCSNTLISNLDKLIVNNSENYQSTIKVNHKGNSSAKLNLAGKLMEKAIKQYGDFELIALKMLETKTSEKDAMDYFVALTKYQDETKETSTRLKNIREIMAGLFTSGQGNYGETLWDAYNAVTEYVDHKQGGRGLNQDRNNRILTGVGANLKSRAFDLAVQMVGVG